MGDISDAVTVAQKLEHMADFFARSVLPGVRLDICLLVSEYMTQGNTPI